LKINFFSEGIEFDLKNKEEIRAWLMFVIESSGKVLDEINYIFSSDEYILDINVKYLGHNYFTDIITFNYNEANKISGDIFISLDTVRNNAEFYKVLLGDEMKRVMVHGILHLIGFNDKDKQQQIEMTSQEDRWLAVYNSKSFLK
jgi:rRNA maturation RNase YbeY